MSVSFDPWVLAFLPLAFVLIFGWEKRHGEVIEDSRVGIVRRFIAFIIDLLVATLGILPLISMPALILEFFSTGKWAWSYEREVFLSRDMFSILLFLMGTCLISYYFSWHLKNSKQTLGQHLLRFKLVPTNDKPNMVARAFVAWINLAWWPIWPWTIFKRKQDYWWDEVSSIKARRVERV
ncbi:MAG: RDD family protein [Pseudomonadota bacterium]